MSFDLTTTDKVALITGGAAGIGRGVAEIFGQAGYRIVVADIDVEQGEKTRRELEEAGVETELVIGDLAQESEARRAVEAAMKRWDRLDFLLNNAGIAGRATPIEALEEDDLERILAVDLKAPFYFCKHAVPAMRKGGGGVILNVSSITAKTGSAYFTAYAAAKSGVVALSQSIARNVGRYNIRVNCLEPGSVGGTGLMDEDYAQRPPGTRQKHQVGLMRKIPLGKTAKAKDIAHFALFLASPLAAHIHGAVLTIDGGESLGFH